MATLPKTLYISGLRTGHLLLFGLPKSPPLSLVVTVSLSHHSLSHSSSPHALSLSLVVTACALSVSLSHLSLSHCHRVRALSLSLVVTACALSLVSLRSLSWLAHDPQEWEKEGEE